MEIFEKDQNFQKFSPKRLVRTKISITNILLHILL